jgi:hypothetical protein
MLTALVSIVSSILIGIIVIGWLRGQDSRPASRGQLMWLTVIPLAVIAAAIALFIQKPDPMPLLLIAMSLGVEIWLLLRVLKS